MSECECITTGYEVPLRGLKFDLDKDAIRQIVREIVGDSGVTQEEVRQMIAEAMQGVVGGAFVPDYANMEDVNRITTWNGTWTADRTGFVYCRTAQGSSGTGCSVRVNDHKAAMICTAGGHVLDVVIAVIKGDVITIGGAAYGAYTTPLCYFIPPKTV